MRSLKWKFNEQIQNLSPSCCCGSPCLSFYSEQKDHWNHKQGMDHWIFLSWTMHFVVRKRSPRICQVSLFCSGNIAFCSLTAVHPEGSYKNGSQLHHGNSKEDAQLELRWWTLWAKEIRSRSRRLKNWRRSWRRQWPFTGINTAHIYIYIYTV